MQATLEQIVDAFRCAVSPGDGVLIGDRADLFDVPLSQAQDIDAAGMKRLIGLLHVGQFINSRRTPGRPDHEQYQASRHL